MERFAFLKENGGNMSYQALNLVNQIRFSVGIESLWERSNIVETVVLLQKGAL